MRKSTWPRSPKGKEPVRYEEDPVSPVEDVGEPSTKPKPKPTTPPRIAFGIELEFLIAECDGPDPDSDIADILPPLLKIDASRPAIKALLESRGLPVKDVSDSQDRFIPSAHFTVSSDPSANESSPTACESGYRWSSIEISTPGQYNTEEAFDLVRLFVSLITSNFRCRVNESTGFHVHVSNGFDKIEGRHARKFGALLWAAEPILSMLHPVERGFVQWSRSIRRVANSRIAMGTKAKTARKHVLDQYDAHLDREYCRQRNYGEVPEPVVVEADSGDLRVYDEEDKVDWEINGYEPFQRPVKTSENCPVDEPVFLNPGRKDIKAGPPAIPSVAQPTDSYEFERTAERTDNFRPVDLAYDGGLAERDLFHIDYTLSCERPIVSDSWTGIAELLASDMGTHQVAQLLSSGNHHRANWNLDHLGGNPVESCNPAWLPDDYIKPESLAQRRKNNEIAAESYSYKHHNNRACPMLTIEAREATGSLDPEWIVTWAKICCGLLEFARDAEISHYMSVVDKCAHATNYDGEYDVVDFLRDMGLFSEANHCERRLARREEAWFDCLLFKPRDREQAKAELPARVWEATKWCFDEWGQDDSWDGGRRQSWEKGDDSECRGKGDAAAQWARLEDEVGVSLDEYDPDGIDMFKEALNFQPQEKDGKGKKKEEKSEKASSANSPTWW